MTPRLDVPLRREVLIDGEPYTIVLDADGLRLSRKRFRGGRTLSWQAIWKMGEDDPEHPPAP